MENAGTTPLKYFQANNTCQYGERIFHFSQRDGYLLVIEVLLGQSVGFETVLTSIPFSPTADYMIACCALGQHILVLSSDRERFSAILVDIKPGRLCTSSIHATILGVVGGDACFDWLYLCPVSGNRALLYFDGQSTMWRCDLADTTLSMTKLSFPAPMQHGFCAVPTRLLDGRLLVAGGWFASTQLTLISATEDPDFEKAGDIPGQARCNTSTILIRRRFVVGFGGSNGKNLGDLWIFDTKTFNSSQIKRKGDWHADDFLVVLAVRDDVLYILGGYDTTSVNSMTLSALSGLIENEEVRLAFWSAVQTGQKENTYDSVLAAAQKEASRVPALLAKVQSLERENSRLRQSLAQAVNPTNAIVLRFPTTVLPDLPLPPKLKPSKADLESLFGATNAQLKSLTRERFLMLEYKTTFSSLLGKSLSRFVFQLSAALCGGALYFSLQHQVLSTLSSDDFPPQKSLPPASRTFFSRQRDKFFDSSVPQLAVDVTYKTIPLRAALSSRVPPVAEHIVSLCEKSDLLETESQYAASLIVRRAARVSRSFSFAQKGGSIRQTVDRLAAVFAFFKAQEAEACWSDSA